MNNDILIKAQNDPAYSQIVQLYSGLFDTQDERETFILDVAEEDILLAAECKTSSVEEEKPIVDNIIFKSESQVKRFANVKYLLMSFLALLELGETNRILASLKEIENPNKSHKIILEKIIRKSHIDKALDILNLLLNLPKTHNSLFFWAIEKLDRKIDTCFYHKIMIIVNKIISKITIKNATGFSKILVNWVEKYNLYNQFHIENLIVKLIQKNSIYSIQLAKNWIEKYMLQDNFFLEKLIIEIELIEKLENNYIYFLEELIEKYEIDNFIERHLIKIMDKINIEKAIYLSNKFKVYVPLKYLIEKCIKGDKNDLLIARKIVLANNQEYCYTKDVFLEILKGKYGNNSIPLYDIWLNDIFSTEINIDELDEFRFIYTS